MVVVSRRAIVGLAAAVPVALALGTLTPAWAASRPAYRRSTWEPWVGRSFTLVGEHGRARAVLASVDAGAGARTGAAQRFSLIFTADTQLPEGTVTVRRRGFEPVSLFTTAVDRGVEAQHRQAVVNRI